MPDGVSEGKSGMVSRGGDRRSPNPRPYEGVERRTSVADRRHENNRQYATFFIEDHLLGVEVLKVQEVVTVQEMTRAPLAPAVIAGLINLRGRIVVAIDLRTSLGFPMRKEETAEGKKGMNVVIQTRDGPISLLVDRIGDVIEVRPDLFGPTPETVDERLREVTEGVYRLKERLLLVLNTERVT